MGFHDPCSRLGLISAGFGVFPEGNHYYTALRSTIIPHALLSAYEQTPSPGQAKFGCLVGFFLD